MKSIFDADPTINSILVYGYTPTFNDGDPCYHHHHHCVGQSATPKYFSVEEIDHCIEQRFRLNEKGLTFDYPSANPSAMHIKAGELVKALSRDLEFVFETNTSLAWIKDPSNSKGFQFFECEIEPEY